MKNLLGFGEFVTLAILLVACGAAQSGASVAREKSNSYTYDSDSVAGGTVTGIVTAEPGGVIPNVNVTIRNTSTGEAKTAKTDTAGIFNVPGLTAGTYEMTVSAPGFVSQVWTNVSVVNGISRSINPVLRVGNQQLTVRVTAPPIDVSQPCADCGTTNSVTAREVPLNGRDWAALTTLQAGVTGVQTGSVMGGGNTDRGFGAPVSVSGARPDQNSYRLDGISINDYSNGAPGSVLGDNLGIDAVEQVSVLASNYPAKYGRTSGGIINVVTRAGSHSFHGSVYEFLRNSALDARNFFDGPVIPPFRRNQFGTSAGLPLQKDRTFIFGDYEGLRQSLGLTTLNTVPSPSARKGILSTGNVTVDPTVARFLDAFYPLPNGPLIAPGDFGYFRYAAQQVTNENYFTIRFDHRFSDRDTFYATTVRDASETIQPNDFGELFSTIVSTRQDGTLHEEHKFNSNMLNVARGGFARAIGIVGGVSQVLNPAMRDPSYGFVPDGFAGGVRLVPGLSTFLGAPTAQGMLSSSRHVVWNSYQGGDDFIITHGQHLIKFGLDVERMQDNELNLSNINGTFRFDSLGALLTNGPSAFTGNAKPTVPEFGTRQTLLGAYVQDDIKLLKTLTLNLGLRYEMATVPTEAQGHDPHLLTITSPQPSIGTPLFQNPTLRNFEPRLGFVWSPGGGKTLVRGGFGIFDVLPLPYEFTLSFQGASPFVQRIIDNTLAPGAFTLGPPTPNSAYTQAAASPNTSFAYYPQPNPKRNYVMQYNLSVARELSSTMALTVGYVGSRGVHLPYRMDNMDMVLPELTSAGYIWPIPDTAPANGAKCSFGPASPTGIPCATQNPYFGRIGATLWQANSFYNALQADFSKRLSHGFTLHAGYTWGKSIDTLSATEADDAFPNGLFNQLYFDQRTTRGLSDFNVAQNLVANFNWELPDPKMNSKGLEWAGSGWQIGGIFKANTGQPFTMILGGDPVGTNLDETGLPPSYISGCHLINSSFKNNPVGPIYVNQSCFTLPQATPAIAAECQPFGLQAGAQIPGSCANLRGDLGRNVLVGPGLWDLDFSVFKNNHVKRISETFNVQFRAEIFNIFNHANFASPTDNLAIFDQNGQLIPSAGLIDSTQTTSRQAQFAIKILW